MNKTPRILCLISCILQMTVISAFLWLDPKSIWHDVLWIYSSIAGLFFMIWCYTHYYDLDDEKNWTELQCLEQKQRCNEQLNQKDARAQELELKIGRLNQEISQLRQEAMLASSSAFSEKRFMHNQLNELRMKLYEKDARTQRLVAMTASKGLEKKDDLGKELLSPQQARDIIEATNEYSNGYATRLQTAFALTDSELLICCLTLFRLQNKQLMVLTSLSEESLKKKKYRIKKKLSSNGTVQLESFLESYQDLTT